MNKISSQIAIALLPVIVLITVCSAWIVWRVDQSYRDALFMMCIAGVPILTVMLSVGFKFYRAHPFVGLLTATSLFALFPISHQATHVDAWQAFFGLLTGLGGGIFTALFLWFSLRTLREESANVLQ